VDLANSIEEIDHSNLVKTLEIIVDSALPCIYLGDRAFHEITMPNKSQSSIRVDQVVADSNVDFLVDLAFRFEHVRFAPLMPIYHPRPYLNKLYAKTISKA
jgi:hypothetical protein